MRERSYDQYCGLARSLDAIGDRWTLLIVRELLLGPRRFGELQSGLPGVASNLLTDRLRTLETKGVIERQLGRPRDGVRYALTSWGEQLREPIDGLIRWSTPLMATGRHGDAFRPSWLAISLRALCSARRARPARRAAFNVEGQAVRFSLGRHGPEIAVTAAEPDLPTVPPELVLGLAAGVPPEILKQVGAFEPNAVDDATLATLTLALAP